MAKRGGLPVIYFVRFTPTQYWMLFFYAKANFYDVPGHILKGLLEASLNG